MSYFEGGVNMTLQEAFKNVGDGIIASMRSGEDMLAHKIDKHISLGNDEKIAFYLVHLFYPFRETPEGFEDQFVGGIKPSSTERIKSVPSAQRAITYLKQKGWSIKYGHVPGYAHKQLIVIFPDGNHYYHSKWYD